MTEDGETSFFMRDKWPAFMLAPYNDPQRGLAILRCNNSESR